MRTLSKKEIKTVSGGNPIVVYLAVRIIIQGAKTAIARGVAAGATGAALEGTLGEK